MSNLVLSIEIIAKDLLARGINFKSSPIPLIGPIIACKWAVPLKNANLTCYIFQKYCAHEDMACVDGGLVREYTQKRGLSNILTNLCMTLYCIVRT